MKRFIAVTLLTIALSLGAFAQSTTVTLQVTDAGGQSWNGGAYSVFLSSSLQSGPLLGANAPTASVTGTLSATGGASFALASGVTWTFRACSLAGEFTSGVFGTPRLNCYNTAVAITGSTQTVTLVPSAIVLNINSPGMDIKAYNDAEVVAAFTGASYYNLTTLSRREWNGTVFNDIGVAAVTTFATLPTCAAALEGQKRSISDSTTVTWGATITGGSTSHALAYCDGTNWTVAAK